MTDSTTAAPAPRTDPVAADGSGAAGSGRDSLTVTDNRTGQTYELEITDGTIRAADLKQISVGGQGLATYDPGFVNTASTRSAVTYIDGDAGILEYRGYPIEQLAEHSTFLEVAYLLLNGELPTQPELDAFTHDVTIHTFLHENVRQLMQGFRYDAHPMGMLMSSVSALSTFYPDANQISDPENRKRQITRLIAKMPTLGAWAFRHNQGKPYVYPDNRLSYVENFLAMLFQDERADLRGRPAPGQGPRRAADPARRPRAELLDQRGPLGRLLAGRPVLRDRGRHRRPLRPAARRRERVGAQDAAPHRHRRQHPRLHRGGEGGQGEAHGLRAPGLQELRPARDDHQEGLRRRLRGHGVNPLLEIAQQLEKIALEDEYFVKRKLYPNVDFYSGLIYEALQFPPEMFTVLFAIGRTPGWLAQWSELVQDKEQKIARPKQIYTGYRTRDFVPMTER